MNERIRLLCSQAISDVDGIQNPDTQDMYIPDCFAEKFAELIVRECVEICLERHDSWKFDDESNSNSGPRDCAQMIEEHFGVEE
ncbi:hypothetical protein UFOVP1146_126 [uncultured Caudovirales phage]|uniref:Uncharacterized protein n=1 Tax=uncultured Caudovirales phage TaxID=2100421 RepID=A0A6J5P2V2_9CAUD|nr:hypothetical protein UFOVP812_39 [uncultured Caudovirales phage]CAB4165569.1 hypothetical protein UFOVP818_105 [uncultured Caudovirales phage]CAB4186780.1 hypothetical protein UFOVP1146_126 [uncultured Caudovirales phage]CAB4220545.1 hypothetical protein UFOVP1638_18 [uncultured Caudovirales phage]